MQMKVNIKAILTGKTKQITPLLLVLMITVAGVGAAITYRLSRQVTTTMRIEGYYDMEILDTDGINTLTDIAFGTLRRNGGVLFSSDPDTYFIESTGDYDLYVSYSLTDWPTDVALVVEVFKIKYAQTYCIMSSNVIHCCYRGKTF